MPQCFRNRPTVPNKGLEMLNQQASTAVHTQTAGWSVVCWPDSVSWKRRFSVALAWVSDERGEWEWRWSDSVSWKGRVSLAFALQCQLKGSRQSGVGLTVSAERVEAVWRLSDVVRWKGRVSVALDWRRLLKRANKYGVDLTASAEGGQSVWRWSDVVR